MATAVAEQSAIQKAGAQPSLVKTLADRYGLEAGKFYGMVKTVIFPSTEKLQPTDEMIMAFLSVCNDYELNPLLKEIYPFVDKNNNLRVIVGIDGWIKTVQRNPKYDGHAFKPHLDSDQKLFAVTCQMFRTDRSRPMEMTEYMHECRRDTDPWKQWPSRMLHHKAFIQSARYAFGMNAFIDDDEADRLTAINVEHHAIEEPRRLSDKSSSNVEPARSAREDSETPSASQASPSASTATVLDSQALSNIWQLGFKKGLSKVDMNDLAKSKFSVAKVQELNPEQAQELIKHMASL